MIVLGDRRRPGTRGARLVRAGLLAAAVAIAGCGGGGVAMVRGQVVFAGGHPASGIAVALAGATTLTQTTAASGHYAFSKVPAGSYVVKVAVPSTLERQEALVVSVGTRAVTLPTLTFTGEGTLSGTVDDAAGKPETGAAVHLLGTGHHATTDGNGAFTLTRLTAGSYRLLATASTATGTVTATGEATVTRGKTATATLTLSAPPPRAPPPAPATITGTVGYPLGSDASTITLKVPGTSASTQAGADGSYSLTVPAGTWQVEATAPPYPVQPVGTVTVRPGAHATLPAKLLSMYWMLPADRVGAGWGFANGSSPNPSGKVLLVHRTAGTVRFYVADVATRALRAVAVLSDRGRGALSPDGTQVAIANPDPLFLLDLSTGAVHTVPLPGPVKSLRYTGDGKALLVRRQGGVDRVDLGTLKVTTLAGSSEYTLGPEKILVWSSGGAAPYGLVTAAGVTPSLLTGVSHVYYGATPYGGNVALLAETACSTTGCSLEVLGPDATALVPVTAPAGSPLTGTVVGEVRGAGPWMAFDLAGGGHFLVDTRTGKAVAMPATAMGIEVAPGDAEGAVLTGTNDDTAYVGTLPGIFGSPTITGTRLHGGWISPTEFVGFDESTTPRRFTVDNGTAATDTDYVAGSGHVNRGLALWVQGSTGRFATELASSPVVGLPITKGATPAGGVLGPAFSGGTTAAALVSWPSRTTSYRIDGTGTVTVLPGIDVGDAIGEAFLVQGVGGFEMLLYGGTTPVGVSEPGIEPASGTLTGNGELVVLGTGSGPAPEVGLGAFPVFAASP